jgi:ssDNA-binding Zn-finger/Zn-ribbon topoisomerase 1
MKKDKDEKGLVKIEETQLSVTSGEKLADYKQELALAAEIYKARKEFLMSQLRDGVHYGTEKGIDKPFLHKPGAETVNTVMEQYPVFRQVEKEVDRETGWVSYAFECDVLKKGTNEMVVQGFRGSANSFEGKRRFRWKNGERVERDAKDLLGDDHNIRTMAEKRAHVGASIIAAGISDQFTYAPEMIDGKPKRKKKDGPPCPKCKNGVLVERTAKKGKNVGGKFWGCDNFPRCKHLQNEAPSTAKDCKHERQKAAPNGEINCEDCGECLSEAPKQPSKDTLNVGMADDAHETPETPKNDCPKCGEEPADPSGVCHKKKGADKGGVKPPHCPDPDCDRTLRLRSKTHASGKIHRFWACPNCKYTQNLTQDEKEKLFPNKE